MLHIQFYAPIQKNGKKLNRKTNNPINKCNNEINKQISKDEIQAGNKHKRGDVQDHQASEKCKPKLSWDFVLAQSQSQSLGKQEVLVEIVDPSLWNSGWRFSKTLIIGPSCYPTIPLLDVYWKDPKLHITELL